MILKYAHLGPGDIIRVANSGTPENFKFHAVSELLRDYDMLFARYDASVGVSAAGGIAGLRMRVPNTVIEAWPMRLKKKFGEEGAEEEFTAVMESSCTGAERYVEWIRKE